MVRLLYIDSLWNLFWNTKINQQKSYLFSNAGFSFHYIGLYSPKVGFGGTMEVIALYIGLYSHEQKEHQNYVLATIYETVSSFV